MHLLRDKLAYAALGLAMAAGCASAATVNCPASITVAGKKFMLNHASVFNGLPKKQTDLIPVPRGPIDHWDLTGVDPYLVCRYRGTTKATMVHAEGAKFCETANKPFRVFCEN